MSDFRAIALTQPSAIELDHFGAPSFRVNGKIFAQLSQDGEMGLVKLSRAGSRHRSSAPVLARGDAEKTHGLLNPKNNPLD